jgi:hypothetical protein
VERADAMALSHAAQIVAQIQEYLARDAENARTIPNI